MLFICPRGVCAGDADAPFVPLTSFADRVSIPFVLVFVLPYLSACKFYTLSGDKLYVRIAITKLATGLRSA